MIATSSVLRRSARNGLCALSLATAALLAVPCTASAWATDTAYVVIMPGGNSSTMSGSTDDYRRAKAYRQGDAGLVYFRDKGAAYVVRDAAILRRAETILAPQQELGARQGALGREQGELGRRQGALGAEQARAGLSEGSGRGMAELGRQQAALGSQQAALGARQAALGKQQAALAKQAEGQLRALFADAMRRGLAQRVQ